jgi:hypothetical protein
VTRHTRYQPSTRREAANPTIHQLAHFLAKGSSRKLNISKKAADISRLMWRCTSRQSRLQRGRSAPPTKQDHPIPSRKTEAATQKTGCALLFLANRISWSGIGCKYGSIVCVDALAGGWVSPGCSQGSRLDRNLARNDMGMW